MDPWNSASGGFTYIRQSKWVGIIAIKNEGTEIHFLSDALVVVASLDLKVPIDFVATTQKGFIYQIWQPMAAPAKFGYIVNWDTNDRKERRYQGIKHP